MKGKMAIIVGFTFIAALMLSCGKASQSGSGSPDDGQAAVVTQSSGGSQPVASGAKKAYKVGYAVREMAAEANQMNVDAARAVIEGAGGTLVVADANTDLQKHNENIENLVNSGIDGLMVFLGDVPHLTAPIQYAKSKGVPVVTTMITANVPGSITDVCANSPNMATMVSNAFMDAIGFKGDVYVVWVPGAPWLEGHKRILEAIVGGQPDVRLHEIPAEHNAVKVQAQIEQLITANPKPGSIAGIFGAYDMLISGAVEAVRQAGRTEIKMVSLDGDRIAFQELFAENSPYVACAGYNASEVGHRAATILLDAMEGKIKEGDVSPITYVSGYLATRYNGVAAAEKAWGLNFWKDAELDKEEIIKRFPQTQPLLEVTPLSPLNP
jgi:ABC-type sugar transport system substrate-binding protein